MSNEGGYIDYSRSAYELVDTRWSKIHNCLVEVYECADNADWIKVIKYRFIGMESYVFSNKTGPWEAYDCTDCEFVKPVPPRPRGTI